MRGSHRLYMVNFVTVFVEVEFPPPIPRREGGALLAKAFTLVSWVPRIEIPDQLIDVRYTTTTQECHLPENFQMSNTVILYAPSPIWGKAG